MKVCGHEIPRAAVEAMLNRMAASSFRASHLIEVAVANGVPRVLIRTDGAGGTEEVFLARRAVDALIQRERKARRIELIGQRTVEWKRIPL